jgi:hypothetical protein
MEEQGKDTQWISVRDIRRRFQLGREWSTPISGFLHRIEEGPLFSYPFIVVRSERLKGSSQAKGLVLLYLVQRRDLDVIKSRLEHPSGGEYPSQQDVREQRIPYNRALPVTKTWIQNNIVVSYQHRVHFHLPGH